MQAVTITQITPPELEELIEKCLRKILRPDKKDVQDEYITRLEVIKMLHITLPTLLKYTTEGKFKGYRIGRRVLYKKNEIELAIEGMSIKIKK